MFFRFCWLFALLLALPLFGQDLSIIDTATGLAVSWEDVASTALNYDAVFLGEWHDNAVVHLAELHLLEACLRRVEANNTRETQGNAHLAISLEMFERDVQPCLDSYLAGKISEQEFLAISRPWPNYYSDYRPLVEFARTHALPVIASNVPRELAARVNHDGPQALDSFTPAERRYAARVLKAPDDEYKRLFTEVMRSGMGMSGTSAQMPGAMIENLYQAQCLKDDTMAESMADYLGSHPGTTIIHYVGDFHSAQGLGTPAKLRGLRSQARILVISPVDIPSDQPLVYSREMQSLGDYVLLVHRQLEKVDNANSGYLPNGVRRHSIRLELDPTTHFLHGIDSLLTWRSISPADTLILLSSLEVLSVRDSAGNIPYRIVPIDETYKGLCLFADKPVDRFRVEYKGEVYTPLTGRDMQQTHDFTPGMVSLTPGEGVYLPAGAFYPALGDSLFDFRLQVTCPVEMKLVSSGRVNIARIDSTLVRYTWIGELPTDQLILVGNRFAEASRSIDGVLLRVMLLPDEAKLTSVYLDSLEVVYRQYTGLLGQYPFSSFTLVENFFPAGFGMPGYTVLARELVRMPRIATAPGSLAHEFVHNWWGNGVFTDPDDGNWCEALTTFCANYASNLLRNDSSAALKWRRDALMQVNRLPRSLRYPLRDFKYQRNDDDAVIGYTWGGMFFIGLHHDLGAEFFPALRHFALHYRGQRADWDDLLAAFPRIPSGWREYLESPVLPRLSLMENPDLSRHVRGKRALLLTIDPPKRQLNVELGYSPLASYPVHCMVSQETTPIYLSNSVQSVDIDPECYLLREIPTERLPYNLERTLLDRPLVVVPDNGPMTGRIAMTVAMLNQSGYELTAVPASGVGDLWRDRSLFVLGSWEDNSFLRSLSLPTPFRIDSMSIRTPNSSLTSLRSSLILSGAHPLAPGRYLSVYIWRSPEAVPSFRRMLHYMNESWSAFDPDQSADAPVAQGDIFPASGSVHDWQRK